MSYKNSLAASVVVLSAFFSEKASAQECTADWINMDSIAETLLSAPISQWNKDAIAGLGEANKGVLINAVNSSLRDGLTRQAKNIFDGIEDAKNNKRDVDWDYYAKEYSPIFNPLLKKLKDEATTVPAARNEAIIVVNDYIGEASKMLIGIQSKEPACFVLAAPTPQP